MSGAVLGLASHPGSGRYAVVVGTEHDAGLTGDEAHVLAAGVPRTL